MRQLLSLLLLGLLVCSFTSAAVADKKHTMKTHSSKVASAKVTVVHFGAPW